MPRGSWLASGFVGILSAMLSAAGERAAAQVLTPSDIYMAAYHVPRLNNATVAETRANAFAIVTNGVVNRTNLDADRVDTWNDDNAGNTLDFVGLQYGAPSRFDFIQIELGKQFNDGGDWQSKPNIYILKNPLMVGDTVEPNMSPNWVLLPAASIPETTGHAFNPTVVPGAGGTVRFDLTGVPAGDRTGWAWAVGGVDGNQNLSNVYNFVSVMEAWAEGQTNLAMTAIPTPVVLSPANVVANVYNSVGRSGDGLSHAAAHVRGQAFASVANGVVNHGSADDGFDTLQSDNAGTLTDFIGLQYSSINRFDSITVELANQYSDGGDWDSMPRIFVLKNPVDTNTSRPETDPTNWREITGFSETTNHVFSPLVAQGAGGTMTFNLASIPASQRTGWGWAVGGVDGNANGLGFTNYISVGELSATGAVLPRPYDLTLKVYSNGEVRLVNGTQFAIDLDFYQITSLGAALDEANWNGLGNGTPNPGTHNPASFPVGNGSGNGWEMFDNLDDSILSEAYAFGMSNLPAGQAISLGHAYSGPAADLKFKYRPAGGVFIDGAVEYVAAMGVAGDFNGSGIVDAADYAIWRNNNGLMGGATPSQGDGNGDGNVTDADYLVWREHFGESAGSSPGAGAVASVPEPGAVFLLFSVCLAGVGWRRRMLVAGGGVSLRISRNPLCAERGEVAMHRGVRTSQRAVVLATVLLIGCGANIASGQALSSDPFVQLNFTGMTEIGSSIGPITQMAFGPDGKLYVGTFGTGVKRYDYNPNGSLTNGITVWSRTATGNQVNGSLGVAFHQDPTLGTVMYLAPAVTFGANPTINITQSIVRLTDNDGDGSWGETGEVNQAIVNNLRVTDLHQVNQMLVRDNALYVAIGSRTRTGGNVSEYGGAPNTDDGEFAYTGAINWIRDLTQLSGNTTTANLAGHTITQHHTDTQPFTSANTGKLTVFSTGFRNPYGLAFDGEGDLWATMNQNENPQLPDELHQTNFKDDHSFPKKNEVSGDWKLNATAIGAGFFQTFKSPLALLGNNASADGIVFTDRNGAFDDRPFVVRYANGDDLISVNPETGTFQQIATGLANPLALLADPNGNLLLGTHGSGGRIYRIGVAELSGIDGDFNNDSMLNASDWSILKNHFNQMLAGTPQQVYALGDMNIDLKVDYVDFGLFKASYEDANGAGSFAALGEVPEPTTWAASIGMVAWLLTRSRRRSCYGIL